MCRTCLWACELVTVAEGHHSSGKEGHTNRSIKLELGAYALPQSFSCMSYQSWSQSVISHYPYEGSWLGLIARVAETWVKFELSHCSFTCATFSPWTVMFCSNCSFCIVHLVNGTKLHSLKIAWIHRFHCTKGTAERAQLKGLFANIQGTNCTSKWPFANIDLVTIRAYTALAIHVHPPDRIKGNAHALKYSCMVLISCTTLDIQHNTTQAHHSAVQDMSTINTYVRLFLATQVCICYICIAMTLNMLL